MQRRARRHRSVRDELRSMSVEDAAQHVFVTSPRVLRFAHRELTSLRHPYVALVAQRVQAAGGTHKARTQTLLEMLVDCSGEVGKWARAGAVFDLKLDSHVLDDARLALLRSPEVTACLEQLWHLALRLQQQRGCAAAVATSSGAVASPRRCSNSHHTLATATRVVDTCDSLLYEDAYRHVQQCWYNELLQCSDAASVALRSIIADFAYDVRVSNEQSDDEATAAGGVRGVCFAAFCLGTLEVADNWTSTRDVGDGVQLLRRLAKALHDAIAGKTAAALCSDDKSGAASVDGALQLPAHAYYSGGVLACRKRASGDEYVKLVCT